MDQPEFDFAAEFAGRSSGEIAQAIGPIQTQLLRQFFGRSLRGAQAASQNFQVPQDLTSESLEAYHEIARRAIEAGQDQLGVQRIRIGLVERALHAPSDAPST